jgi:hypothetical protein
MTLFWKAFCAGAIPTFVLFWLGIGLSYLAGNLNPNHVTAKSLTLVFFVFLVDATFVGLVFAYGVIRRQRELEALAERKEPTF